MNNDKNSKEILKHLSAVETILNKLLSQQPIHIHWVSRKKAAELYDVSQRTIYNWQHDGQIKFKEINGKDYYSVVPLLKEIDNSNNKS